jgi:hypothetical protein
MSDSRHTASRDEFQLLWAELPPTPPMSSEQVRAYAHKVTTGLRRRAIISAVVLVLGIGNPVVATLLEPRPLPTWQWVVAIGLIVWVVVMLWITRASRRRRSSQLDTIESVHAYRALLENERDMHRGRLLVPRLVVPLLGGVVSSTVLYRATGLSPVGFWVTAALVGIATGWIWFHSVRRARLFQAHIDRLDESLSD